MLGTMDEIARTLYEIPEWRAALERAQREYKKRQRGRRKRGGQLADDQRMLEVAAIIRCKMRSDGAAIRQAAQIFYKDDAEIINAVRRMTDKLKTIGRRGHRLEAMFKVPPGVAVTLPKRITTPNTK
jgi:hypothetical protein